MNEDSKQNRENCDFARKLIQVVIVLQNKWLESAAELLVNDNAEDNCECSHSQFRYVEITDCYLNNSSIHFDEFPVEMLWLVFTIKIAIFQKYKFIAKSVSVLQK